MKPLEKHFKMGNGDMRGGDEEDMFNYLGAKKGAVTLFSIINDTELKVNLVVDKRLFEEF